MVSYRKILHSTPPLELFTDVQCMQYKNSAQNKNLPLTLNAESQEKLSLRRLVVEQIAHNNASHQYSSGINEKFVFLC
ncbi:unnamed protein product [Rotaria magnacalcarata]